MFPREIYRPEKEPEAEITGPLRDLQVELIKSKSEIDGIKAELGVLNQIRATLYVNFVQRETLGVQLNDETFKTLSTHDFMFTVLEKVLEQNDYT